MKRLVWAGLVFAWALGAGAQDTAIYMQGGSAVLEGAAAAIKTAQTAAGLPAPVGPVVVATTQAQATADLQDLDKKGVKFVYALGTSASTLAAQNPKSSGIYVFVPNPSLSGLTTRPSWSGVSPYPDPKSVMQYLKGAMAVQRVAILYTRKSNQEIAKLFEDAASAERVTAKLVGLNDPGELEAALPPALKDADMLLLLIDPVTFNPDSVRFIVSTCLAAKKPSLGFLDSVPKMGGAFALYPPPDELGRTAVSAMQALRQKGEDRKVWFPQRFVMGVNDSTVKSLGLTYDASKVAGHF